MRWTLIYHNNYVKLASSVFRFIYSKYNTWNKIAHLAQNTNYACCLITLIVKLAVTAASPDDCHLTTTVWKLSRQKRGPQLLYAGVTQESGGGTRLFYHVARLPPDLHLWSRWWGRCPRLPLVLSQIRASPTASRRNRRSDAIWQVWSVGSPFS